MNKVKKNQILYKYIRRFGLDGIANQCIKTIKKIRFNQHAQSMTEQIKLSYDHTWETLIKSEASEKLIEGALIDWDNTARKTNGYVHLGASPEKFGKYMRMLYKKIDQNKQEPLVFINAWNEWCEGAYLEPDEKHKYGYLEVLKSVVDE